MRKFSIAKIASLIFVCVMLFAALTISVCAEEATDSTDVGDVFTFSGYSINEENGDACFGFTLNHAAKDALEIVDFGYIIVSYDKLNGQSPIDANGNAVELENGKAFVQSLKGYENTNYTFKLVNLSGEYSSRKYVITPYICDGTDVFYYNEKGEITNTVTGVSYEEMVELSPHEHTYENGYCTVCELVDPDYYFTMTIPEALNAELGTKVQVSGTVSEIYGAWNETYGNMSAYIVDETGNKFLCFRIDTLVEIGDIITVKGEIGEHDGVKQLAQGGTANIDVKHVCSEYTEATCTAPKTCKVCGKTEGELADHNYVDGKCLVCGAAEGMSITDTKYTFADYTAGTQYAENEEHVLDENVTVVTTQSHFTTELRIYSSSTHNGYAIIKSANTITKIAVNAGNKVDTLVVYGSNDEGATWTEAAKISVTSTSYGDYEAELAASYKWLKLDVEGEQQIRIKSMTLTAVSCTHVHQTTTKTESTCTENGYEVVTCNACDAEISRVELALADHNYVGVVTEPTCTAAGYTTYTCSACEASYEEAGEAALGHSYDANDICERCGSEKHVCEFTSEVTKEPTCTEKGERTYTCTSCENSYTEEIALIAHTETEIPAVAPTCTTAGATAGVKCSVCETVITAPEAIDALGHSYTDGVCANGCGIDDPDYYYPMSIADALAAPVGKKVVLTGVISSVAPWNTQYGNMEAYLSDGNGNKILLYRIVTEVGVGDKVSVQGEIGVYNDVNQIAQNGSTVTITEKHVCSEYTEATCQKLAACVVCGTETGDFAAHNYVNGVCSVCSHEEGTAEVVTITASKTVADLITEYGWTSSTTKQTFTLDEKVTVQINGGSNTGKAYDGNHIRIYATDTPAGTVTISVPKGYELVSIKISTITGTYAFLYVDGTTTDISNVETSVSGTSVLLNSVKNGSNGKQVRITAMEVVYTVAGGDVEETCDHASATGVETTPATCTEKGEKTFTCPTCEHEWKEEIEALGHSYDEGVETTPATCTEAGVKTSTCSICGDVKTEEIPATDHNYVDGVCTICQATEDGEGDDVETPEEKTTSVTKSHTEIAAIAGVSTSGGNIAGKEIALNEDITIVCAKGTATTAPTIYSESIRLYQNGATLTVKASNGCKIKTVILTLANNAAGDGPISVAGGTASDLENYVYTITADEDATEIVITTTGTDKNSRLYVAGIKVDYVK